MEDVKAIVAKMTAEELRSVAEKVVKDTLARRQRNQDNWAKMKAMKQLLVEKPELQAQIQRILKGEKEIIVATR